MKAETQAADERLLVAAAQRDPRAFAALYERHFDRVYSYAARRLATREEAEDVTAEVFRRALENLGSFAWRGVPFVAWLYRIAANLIADQRPQAATPPENSAAEPVDEAAAAKIERRALLYGLVAKLPPDQRRVIEMRFAEQKSLRDIARDLQRSEGAIKQLQFRALQNLRTAMEGENG